VFNQVECGLLEEADMSVKVLAGIPYETIASIKGIEQMDLLDAQRSIVLARTPGGLNLSAVALP
jgi:hypothetical protein